MSEQTARSDPPEVHPSISFEELRARLSDHSLVVVDVLPAESYAARHIPGALNLPVADLPHRARALLPNPSAEIAVYCAAFT